MKKIITILFLAVVVMNITPAFASSVKENAIVNASSNSLTANEVNVLTNRLYQIKSMDISKLNVNEKQQLRNEVLSIQKRFNDPLAGGIYISAGALIIIIILLIIIL